MQRCRSLVFWTTSIGNLKFRNGFTFKVIVLDLDHDPMTSIDVHQTYKQRVVVLFVETLCTELWVVEKLSVRVEGD